MATIPEANSENLYLLNSTEQYNKEINEAIARVEAGDYYTQAEVEEVTKT